MTLRASGMRADRNLRIRSSIVLQVEGNTEEAYARFDKAADRAEKSLQKLKARQRDRGNRVPLPKMTKQPKENPNTSASALTPAR